jgi:hypothetical protein
VKVCANVRPPAPAEKSFEARANAESFEKGRFTEGNSRCRVDPLRSSRSRACFQTARS